jgi:hypothetical protein
MIRPESNHAQNADRGAGLFDNITVRVISSESRTQMIGVLVSGHVDTTGTDKRELMTPGDAMIALAATRHTRTCRGTGLAELVEGEVR